MKNEPQNLEFLQSSQWRQFQASVGRRTFFLENEGFLASVIEHELPVVGRYLYCPRGPVVELETQSVKREMQNTKLLVQNMERGIRDLLELAKKEKAGWIRIEPENEEMLEMIRNSVEINGNKLKIVRAPHDMQPREVFVVDIKKDKEALLGEMKPKTRYNIKLAQKRGVVVHETWNREDKKQETKQSCLCEEVLPRSNPGRCLALDRHEFSSTKNLAMTKNIQNTNLEAFLKLTKEMAQRHGITAHPENYYRKMIETLPSEMLRIYVAQYDGQIIAANLVLFFGKTATYLHGASGNEHRSVMAPFLLQWQAMLDAKERGFERYDFGGVKTISNIQHSTDNKNTWEGITTFKLGFSPNTQPVEFPGSYDIVVNPRKYAMYRGLQRAKGFLHKIRK
jgi:lipid II:glycine glycyltransferase (peptidoglycan interpeptide bridge formation enzyme)